MLTEQGWLLESRRRVRPGGRCAREVSMPRKGKTGAAPDGASWSKPVAGILTAGVALLSLLALISYRPRGLVENWAGPVGHSLAGALLEGAGYGGYVVAGGLLVGGTAPLAGP